MASTAASSTPGNYTTAGFLRGTTNFSDGRNADSSPETTLGSGARDGGLSDGALLAIVLFSIIALGVISTWVFVAVYNSKRKPWARMERKKFKPTAEKFRQQESVKQKLYSAWTTPGAQTRPIKSAVRKLLKRGVLGMKSMTARNLAAQNGTKEQDPPPQTRTQKQASPPPSQQQQQQQQPQQPAAASSQQTDSSSRGQLAPKAPAGESNSGAHRVHPTPQPSTKDSGSTASASASAADSSTPAAQPSQQRDQPVTADPSRGAQAARATPTKLESELGDLKARLHFANSAAPPQSSDKRRESKMKAKPATESKVRPSSKHKKDKKKKKKKDRKRSSHDKTPEHASGVLATGAAVAAVERQLRDLSPSTASQTGRSDVESGSPSGQSTASTVQSSASSKSSKRRTQDCESPSPTVARQLVTSPMLREMDNKELASKMRSLATPNSPASRPSASNATTPQRKKKLKKRSSDRAAPSAAASFGRQSSAGTNRSHHKRKKRAKPPPPR